MRRLCIMRKDLNMSVGKLSAMVGHAFEIYWIHKMKEHVFPITESGEFLERENMYKKCAEEIVAYDVQFFLDKDEYEEYVNGIITKTVCAAKNKNHLLKAKTIAEELGLKEGKDFGFIRDLCLTELEPEDEDGRTTVGMWFKPLSDDVAHNISKKYQLYK